MSNKLTIKKILFLIFILHQKNAPEAAVVIITISSNKPQTSITVGWFRYYSRPTHNAQRIELMSRVMQTLKTGATTAGLLGLGRVGGMGGQGGACVRAVVTVAAELSTRVSILHQQLVLLPVQVSVLSLH